jgi:uncharacterized membrane protein
MRPSQVGLLFGAILGLALILDGLGSMLVVALVAFVGWLVARVVQGDLDLADLVAMARPDSARDRP